jgi:competence protein ComEC
MPRPRWSIILLCTAFTSAPAAEKALTAYMVDVEGGQATLFVTPSGQSVLIDTGFPGNNGRDAERIAKAAADAGVKQIDYLLITHFHADHVGGVPAIAARLPIRNYIDHGETVENTGGGQKLYDDYIKETAKAKRTIVKPGDKLPIDGVDWTIVSAAGKVLEKPLKGAGRSNADACAAFKEQDADPTENAQSTGSIVAFGKFRLADLGDLTWNKEEGLVCPANKLGPVDLYIVSHHGQSISGSPALLAALRPKAAIMENGERKGGSAEAWEIIHANAGAPDIWQLHRSAAGGAQHNSDEKLIANLATQDDAGNYIKVVAHSNGHFEISNPRTGYSKQY